MINSGSPSFWRSVSTCVSSVLVEPSHSVSHTSRMIRSRVTARPASPTSSARRSNSFGRSSSSASPRHARRAATSTTRSPACSGSGASAGAVDTEEPLRAGDIAVDRGARRAWRDGEELALRPKEFDLLTLLVEEAGRAVTRERIMSEVWDTDWMGSTKTLDTHVLALRNKLGADAITTLRGVGYRFEVA